MGQREQHPIKLHAQERESAMDKSLRDALAITHMERDRIVALLDASSTAARRTWTDSNHTCDSAWGALVALDALRKRILGATPDPEPEQPNIYRVCGRSPYLRWIVLSPATPENEYVDVYEPMFHLFDRVPERWLERVS